MSSPNHSNAPTEEETPEEETILLSEALELSDEAAAVLGAANDKACSYSEGYLPRQALYSCLTCIPAARTDHTKAAGVCLGCCFHCHDGHDLVELYTKRNFRCDCGNAKFSGAPCALTADKDATNALNAYNQNFAGLYCTCKRPYPDPEDAQPDEMVQCVLCEDWFHARHLGVPPPEAYAEMVCDGCVRRHEFLLHYDPARPPAEGIGKACRIPDFRSEVVGAMFFPEVAWRAALCRCVECEEMYKNEGIEFLVDVEDSVQAYEEKSKAKQAEREQQQDKRLMDSMDRVQQVEMISAYNDLKSNLGQYLQKFADNKKVIREEDIREFFDGMRARKKQKLAIPPNFCR